MSCTAAVRFEGSVACVNATETGNEVSQPSLEFAPLFLSDQPMEAGNATFERLTLSLEMHTNSNNSKWELASMTVNYKVGQKDSPKVA